MSNFEVSQSLTCDTFTPQKPTFESQPKSTKNSKAPNFLGRISYQRPKISKNCTSKIHKLPPPSLGWSCHLHPGRRRKLSQRIRATRTLTRGFWRTFWGKLKDVWAMIIWCLYWNLMPRVPFCFLKDVVFKPKYTVKHIETLILVWLCGKLTAKEHQSFKFVDDVAQISVSGCLFTNWWMLMKSG